MAAADRDAQVLRRAAALIERRGWCRGEFQDVEGRVCLEFALLCAQGREATEARRLVEEELAGRGSAGQPLVAWNDHHAAGELEVLDVLRAAAARAVTDLRASRPHAGRGATG